MVYLYFAGYTTLWCDHFGMALSGIAHFAAGPFGANLFGANFTKIFFLIHKKNFFVFLFSFFLFFKNC